MTADERPPAALRFSLSALVAGQARSVPATRAFAWFEEAMRLFKRAPIGWCLLSAITLASEFGLQLIPGIGVAAAKVIVPVVECGMLIAAVAADQGAPLELRFAFTTFGARPGALAAVVVSGLVVFTVEAIAAFAIAGVNLLASGADAQEMSAAAMMGVLAAGTLVSLPVMFVPFAALFARASFIASFVAGVRGFALNVVPLTVFGALALVLVALGVMTYGIGLIAVFPLVSAASYAAWKDIFDVTPMT